MKKVVIYTDGACSGNPGPGGWGAVLIYNGHELELSGSDAPTTNQRMELTAPLMALNALKEPCVVEVYSDSAYLIRAFNEHWLDNWQRNGWRNSKKEPVANEDLWHSLLAAAARHEVTWHKVKGHSNDKYNERCDALARQAGRNG